MAKRTGGAAFPTNEGMPQEGMTLRDYFAAKAMAAMLATRPWDEQPTASYFAEHAYAVADAMLAERAK